MADKLKYIEETKETMENNMKKLSEIVQDISELQTGKNILFLYVSEGGLWHV